MGVVLAVWLYLNGEPYLSNERQPYLIEIYTALDRMSVSRYFGRSAAVSHSILMSFGKAAVKPSIMEIIACVYGAVRTHARMARNLQP